MTIEVGTVSKLAMQKMERILIQHFPNENKTFLEQLRNSRFDSATSQEHYLDIISQTHHDIRIMLTILTFNDLLILLDQLLHFENVVLALQEQLQHLVDVLTPENHLDDTTKIINSFMSTATDLLPHKKPSLRISLNRPNSAPPASQTPKPIKTPSPLKKSVSSRSVPPLSPLTLDRQASATVPAVTSQPEKEISLFSSPIQFFKKYTTGTTFGAIFGIEIFLMVGLILDIFTFGLTTLLAFSLYVAVISLSGLAMGIGVGSSIEKYLTKSEEKKSAPPTLTDKPQQNKSITTITVPARVVKHPFSAKTLDRTKTIFESQKKSRAASPDQKPKYRRCKTLNTNAKPTKSPSSFLFVTPTKQTTPAESPPLSQNKPS